MTIHITKTDAESFEVVSGHQRLKTMLEVNGKATVEDTTTGEQFVIHVVSGRLQIMTKEELQNVMREGRKWNPGAAQTNAAKSAPFYRQFAKSKY